MVTYLSLFCSALRAALGTRRHLVLENLALRQQLAVLSRQTRRPRLDLWGAKMSSVSGKVDVVRLWGLKPHPHSAEGEPLPQIQLTSRPR